MVVSSRANGLKPISSRIQPYSGVFLSEEEEVKVKVDIYIYNIYRLVKGRWPIGKTPCSSGAVR